MTFRTGGKVGALAESDTISLQGFASELFGVAVTFLAGLRIMRTMHRRTVRTRFVLRLTVSWFVLRSLSAMAADSSSGLFSQSLDFSFGGASGATKVTVSWSPLLTLLDDRLVLGLGGRLEGYFLGDGLSFGNADSSLVVPGANAFALNAFVQARVRLVAGLQLGANIDVIGYGLGSTVTGEYSSVQPPTTGPISASVSHFNLLELGSGDRGQLDSELFAAYEFEDWGIRAGFTHFANEFTTEQPQQGGRSRFRHSFSGGFAAIYFRF